MNGLQHTTDASPLVPKGGHEDTSRMRCLQVWGGSGLADTSVSTTGLDVWLYSKPYGHQDHGGDVYYLSSCSSGRITRLALADVRGHGERVSGLAASLRKLMGRHIDQVSQRRLVQSINREFTSIGDASAFATGLIATFFLPTGTLTLMNAGHPPPLHYNARHQAWRTLDHGSASSGLFDVPLGMFEATTYTEVAVRLERDDRLLWFTDGLEECVDERGTFLGREGILSLVSEMGHLEPDQVIPEIVHRLTSMSAENLSCDDVTIMLIRPNDESVSMRDNLLAPFRYLSNLAAPRT